MKTTSKRRVLISSVAMLLVAMLALGTATYAWFTTDSTTTAKGINVKTTKKSTLVVSSVSSDWTDNLNYELDTTFQPASSNDGVNWYKAVADSIKSYAATNGEKIATPKEENGNVFVNMLNVKNEGAEAATKVHIKATLKETQTNGVNYVRVALVPAKVKDGEEYVDVTDSTRSAATVASAEAFKANMYGTGSAKLVDHVGDDKKAESGAIVADSTATAAKGMTIDVNVGKLDPGAAQYYMLMVWFEGQSENCKDANAGNTLNNLTFSITDEGKTE